MISTTSADNRADKRNRRKVPQDYLNNMPDSFRDGDKGQTAQEALDHLESAYDELDRVDLEEIIGELEEAAL